jgi:hemerythrin superfamily protein
VSNDAIVMLKDDHKEILSAFSKFEDAGEGAHKTKGKLVERIIELLTVHTYIENEVMYPRVRELVPELEDDVLESYEEHHVADVLVMELLAMQPEDERFTAKTTVLIENVRHHIEEEEDEWFPKVREALGRTALQEIGEAMAEAKKTAPRHPAQPSALKKTIDAVIS